MVAGRGNRTNGAREGRPCVSAAGSYQRLGRDHEQSDSRIARDKTYRYDGTVAVGVAGVARHNGRSALRNGAPILKSRSR
jgi:hypothetical protein